MSRIAEILSEYTELEQVRATPLGAKMCCPYHADSSNNAMHIQEEKGIVKCFSCGEFRPLFSFLVEHGVPFEVGIDYAFSFQPDGEKRDLNELTEFTLGRQIPKSFLDKGLEIETLQHFKVGYDPLKGHTTIPLYFNDKLYGIKYREYPKNFWFSEGFVREAFIYNFEPTEERYYVEGETDTMRTWQNGTHNVSALLGCEVTEQQAALMSAHKKIYMALDNDAAGYKGMFRLYDMLRDDVEIFVVPYKAEDAGACPMEEWIRATKNPRTFLSFQLALLKNNKPLHDDIVAKLERKTLLDLKKAKEYVR